MKIRYNQIMSFAFTNAFKKIAQAEYELKIAYNVKKFADELGKHRKVIQTEYQELIQSFAKKDEDGSIIHPEGNPSAFDIDDARQEEWKTAEAAFEAKEVELKREKIPSYWLGAIQFSPADLAALEPVIDFEADVNTTPQSTGLSAVQ